MTRKHSDTSTSAVHVTPASLPAHLIARQIGSFLDRCSLNRLELTNKEIHAAIQGMKKAWPHTTIKAGGSSILMGAQSLAFTTDGSHLACRSRGGNLEIWNRLRGKQVEWTSRAPFCFGNLTFSPNGALLACDGSHKTIRLYEVSTGDCAGVFRGHQGSITSIAFSRLDPNFLASGSTDSTVRIWNIVSHTEQAVLQGNSGGIYSINVSAGGQLLASGGADGILRVWSLEQIASNEAHDFCQNLHGHDMTIVDVKFVENDVLISASLDRTLRIWSATKTSECQQTTSYDYHDGRRRKRRSSALSFSCHRVIKLELEALSIGVSHGGIYLAVGLANETISIWNLRESKDTENHASDGSSSQANIRPSTVPLRVLPGKVFCFAKGVMAVSAGREVRLLPDDFSQYY